MRSLISAFVLIAGFAPQGAPLPVACSARAIDVIVEGDRGQFIRAVRPSDLDLVVDGAPHSIEAVTPLDRPVSLVVLLDASLSVTARVPVFGHANDARSVVHAMDRALMNGLLPGDRVRVGRFAGSTLTMSKRFTSDPTEISTAITEVLVQGHVPLADALGPSPMVDVVARVAELLTPEPGRHAILLVTDGESSGNRLSVEDAARQAAARGVAVHVMTESPGEGEVDLTSVRYPHGFSRDRLVSRLATLTGGVLRKDDRLTRSSWGFTLPSPPFQYFFDAMHSALGVTFCASGVSDGTAVEVKAKDPKLRVTAAHWLPK